MPNNRRRLQGTVVSAKMDKTVVVEVERSQQHRLYRKVVRYKTKYLAHDESNTVAVGDQVQIVESRPISKRKRWAVEAVVDTSQGEETPVAVDAAPDLDVSETDESAAAPSSDEE